jgi:hypothetical protein
MRVCWVSGFAAVCGTFQMRFRFSAERGKRRWLVANRQIVVSQIPHPPSQGLIAS